MRKSDLAQLGQIRILVAEDDVASQHLACAILEYAGYEAKVVANGEAVIKALESSPYDLVLMDCSMPVMDGMAATQSIRAADSRVLNRNVPFIALTANSMREYEQQCQQAGMDGYVSKPIDPSSLIQTIDKCLEKFSRQQTAVVDDESSVTTPRNSSELAPGLLDTIVELFLEDAPKQIEELQTALTSGDGVKLQLISHKLRGTYEFLGTTSIAALASSVEKASKCGEVDKAAEFATKLLEEMQNLHTNLTAIEIQEDI